MPFSLFYNLTGMGWAECRIVTDDADVTVTASYLSDALADLAKAVLALGNGKEIVLTAFAEEPGEFEWIFERYGADNVIISIKDFPHRIPLMKTLPKGFRYDPDKDSKCILEVRCSVQELIAALVSAMDNLVKEYGKAGYKRRWGFPFPTVQYNKLKTLLHQYHEQHSDSQA